MSSLADRIPQGNVRQSKSCRYREGESNTADQLRDYSYQDYMSLLLNQRMPELRKGKSL